MDRKQWIKGVVLVVLISVGLFEFLKPEYEKQQIVDSTRENEQEQIPPENIPQEKEEKMAAPSQGPSVPENNSKKLETTLELVFACDTTGSMGNYIEQAKENIQSIISEVVSLAQTEVRFALIEYRDFPPQEITFVTRVSPFTQSVAEMESYVNRMEPYGGGDGPEAVTEALWEALQLPWREESAKVLILISDAPPHGLEEYYDNFPNGDPTGRDPLVLAGLMANKGIVIYSVGVEPGLGTYRHGRDFMMALAKITEGQFLPLTNAKLLPTVVIGGAVEEISLARYMEFVREQTETLQAAGLAEEEIKAKVFEYLSEQEGETFQLKVDDIYDGSYDYQNRDIMVTSGSLLKLKDSGALNAFANADIQFDSKSPSDFTESAGATAGDESILFQSATISVDSITLEQTNKLYSRYMNSKLKHGE